MLNKDSLEWAINFIQKHSDGDLFPKIVEMEAIDDNKDEFIDLIEGKPLSEFLPGACRRFLVPKDELSYRQATQLDPQDSILLTSILFQYGMGIENRRKPANVVFSYRFSPDINFGLYSLHNSWNDFWTEAFKKSQDFQSVLYCDIADFYNQIYHHTVENQLIDSGIPNQETKWIINLLKSTTAGVSRGIPIGPHPIHLIAEATMIPIDNSLTTQGYEFLRYADDILIFCNSKEDAKAALAVIAKIIDKQQRLMLQRHKTKIYGSDEFRDLCASMIEDRPITNEEDTILKLISKYSGGNPYATITYNQISQEDWETITEEIIAKIIYEYLNKEEVDYIRLRWFYRRLAQIGHPGAIEVSLNEIIKLNPCFSNVCTYLASVQSIGDEQWKEIGKRLLDLLDLREVRDSEFFRILILSLFTRNRYINHFSVLAKKFPSSESSARREILLAANKNSAFDWLREQKESFLNMDSWQKAAYIYSISGLPKDDKKYFINRQKFTRPFEKALAKWSKNLIL